MTEEIYTYEILELLEDWKTNCTLKQNKHIKMGAYLKIKYNVFALIQLSIPIVLIPITQLIENPEHSRIVSSFGFGIVAVSTMVLNLFSFKVQSTKHENAANSYALTSEEIHMVVSLPEKSRSSPTLFLAKLRNEIKNLDKYSPNLEGGCCSDRYCVS